MFPWNKLKKDRFGGFILQKIIIINKTQAPQIFTNIKL